MPTHAASLALTVSTAEGAPYAQPGTSGYYHHASQSIWLRPDRHGANMAATLAHELAPSVTHDAAVDRHAAAAANLAARYPEEAMAS